MKKVLLIYNDFNRETKETLSKLSNLLLNALEKACIQEDCHVDTCKMTSCRAKSENYDMVAGYHIETDISLYLSQHFPGRYVHFFDSYYMFALANVTKCEEICGCRTYKISPIPINP